MMLRSVFSKTCYDKRVFTLGWMIGVMALLGFTAAFFPTIKGSGIDQLFESIPPAMKNMVGDIESYSTFVGYTGSAVFGLRAQMLFVPLAIILGYSLGVSEEASGKLYQLLAMPLSRRRIALAKFVAGLVLLAGIVVMGCVAVAGVALAINEAVPVEFLSRAIPMSVLFVWALFSVTYSLGIATGRKSITLLVPLAWVMYSIVCDAFASQVDWLETANYASILNYYHTADYIHSGIDAIHVMVLACIIIIPICIALLVFPRRDIKEEE